MVVWQRFLRSAILKVSAKIAHIPSDNAVPYRNFTSFSRLQGQITHLYRPCDITSRRTREHFYLYFQHKMVAVHHFVETNGKAQKRMENEFLHNKDFKAKLWYDKYELERRDINTKGFVSSKNLLADADNMEPVSSPLIPVLGAGGQANTKGFCRKTSVQAIKKGIRQSPKKVNLVAHLVRGMRVEDALLQLQVLVKRAAKTVYEVIHSARANASHNHGLDPDKLIVAEAFVGKGVYLKRISYHAKGRSGIMVRPKCRLTVVVRETTPKEEAKIAKLKVMNYKKLSRRERQLVPHQLIEVRPRWSRKRNEEAAPSS